MMISFTSNVKNEVASYEGERNENISMLSAIIRNSGKYDKDSITVTTENSKVAKRVYLLLSDIYNTVVTINDMNNTFNRNRLYIIKAVGDINFILKDLLVVDDKMQFLPHIDSYLIDSEEEKRAYLKGVFLSCGSVNDPKTSRYHLEIFVDNKEEADFINDILNDYYLNSKIILKEKKYMIYIKEAEKIGDFL